MAEGQAIQPGQAGGEAEAREAIERMLRDWDNAFATKDVYGLLGHYVPGEVREEENTRRAYENVMYWTERMEAATTIRQFSLDGSEARVLVEVQVQTRFREPEAQYWKLGQWVLRVCRRFVFVERTVERLTWAKTAEGWLCRSEEVVSSKMRLQRFRGTL